MSIKWTTNAIRKAWLDFWKSKEHLEVPSKSLIPINDPSLIWINSGVATLKKYFSGIETPPANRLTNSQKAIRTNDIENVGLTSRHHTFFEMMGNFSIGDYFKKEAIEWGFELLTKVFNFPIEKLYFTVYLDDQDAYDAWVKCGVNPKHIAKCNKDRNFWDVGQGPCGPCTEIYYDRGKEYDPKNIGEELFFKDIENDRYVEIWNIVFSQFNNDGHNNYTELAHKNIDTGCGLERLACVLQNTYTNFEIDIYADIIKVIATLTTLKYKPDNYLKPSKEQTLINYAFRIIADHLKACTFAIADGAIPSNKERGYIIRKLLRRAVVYAHKLNITESIIRPVVSAVVKCMKDYYPYLEDNKERIIECLEVEETQFKNTLKKGIDLFNHSVKNNKISGDVAFKLLDTYGFPIELTQELAAQSKIKVDIEEFKKLLAQHQDISRTQVPAKAMAIQNATLMDFTKPSIFHYDFASVDGKIIGLFDKDFNEIKQSIPNQHIWVVLDQTVIYANCGGEVSDWGWIEYKGKKIQIIDAIKGPNGQHFHDIVCPDDISLKLGDDVKTIIDLEGKKIIAATHSCEHLLQSALQRTVDQNIKQMGALKNHHKLTFDFQHHEKLTDEKLQEIEDLINNWVKKDYKVDTLLMTLEEAQKIGAKAYFTEVYKKIKDKLRVVKMGDVSCEICAGRHVPSLGAIEQFHILKLTSKGSGAWRIEAIATNSNTARCIEAMNQEITQKIKDIKKEIKEIGFDNQQFIDKINNFVISNQWKQTKQNLSAIDQLEKEFFKLHAAFKKEQHNKMINNIIDRVKVNPDDKYVLLSLDNVDSNILSHLVQQLVNKYTNNGFIILNYGDKLSYIISKHPKNNNLAKANEIISKFNKLTNGRGGGKDNYAQGSCEATKNNLQNILSVVEEYK